MKNLSQKILLGLVAVLILTLATSPWWSLNNVSAQSIKDRFNGILVDHDADINGDLDVAGTTTLADDLTLSGTSSLSLAGGNLDVLGGDTTLNGGLEVQGTSATVLGGSLDVAGTTTLADFVVVSPQVFTVTAGLSITVSSSYMKINSAAPVTTDTTEPIVAGSYTGQIVIIENVNASDAITIDGTGGTVECKADIALASLDTATMMFDGTQWVCLSVYDNS